MRKDQIENILLSNFIDNFDREMSARITSFQNKLISIDKDVEIMKCNKNMFVFRIKKQVNRIIIQRGHVYYDGMNWYKFYKF